MRKPLFTLSRLALSALAVAGLLALPAHAAGTVEVKYVEAEKFMDFGFGKFERDRNQASLDQSFQRLARLLPDGQTLKIDVLDVDLAGEVRHGAVRDVRVVRGGVDWPRIKLRYSLQAGTTTLKSGEQSVADMHYLFGVRSFGPRDGALPYEQRLIDRWFSETIASSNH